MKLISYDKETMALHLGDTRRFASFQCPFATWWKARKWFKRPRFKFYFGPTFKFKGLKVTEFGEYDDYEQKGIWPFASTEALKWGNFMPKWWPISIISWDIGWKDKYNSPRYEHPGHFIIFFGKNYRTCWQFSIQVNAPITYSRNDCTEIDMAENYWESILWYLNYAKEYGMPDYKHLDLLKARATMQSHWSRSKQTLIKEFKVLEAHKGINFEKSYCVIKIESEQLRDLCTVFPEFNTNTELMLTMKLNDKTYFFHNDYIYCKFDRSCESNIVEVWFKADNKIGVDEFVDIINSKKFDSLELTESKYVDLGPAFKDEFLTKRGIKLVRDNVSKNKCG